MENTTTTSKKLYTVGNLTYTLPRLLIVSSVMMLATQTLSLVCYCLVPSVKPVLLDKAGASATDIALIIGTIPQALNFFLCPLISTLSDRTRTRIGRRQPYLIFSAPILVAITILIAWATDISLGIQQMFPALANSNVQLWVLAILMLSFQVVFLFPGSVVYYLIADVIPKECIGRYMAISTVIHSVLGAGFSLFLLKPSLEHTKLLFCIFGAAYMLVYVLLLLFAREGSYPDLEQETNDQRSTFHRCKDFLTMFFRQCFQHKIFIFLFLSTGLNQASNICRGMYNILFATKEIGLSIDFYGKIGGIGSIVSGIMVLFLGRIMDKTHPLLIYFIGGIFIMIVNVFGYFFVHTPMTFAVIGISTTLMYAAQGLAYSPLLIDLLPRDKYGQFSSANSMVNSVTVFIGAWLGGKVTDMFGYRIMFVWDFVVTFLALMAIVGVYKEWKRYGGKLHYQPPKIR